MRDGADHVMTVEYDTKEYRPIYGSVQYLEKGDGLSRTLTHSTYYGYQMKAIFSLFPMEEDDARRRRSPRDSRVRH